MADKYTEAMKRFIESIDTMSSEEFKKRYEASKSLDGPSIEEFFGNLEEEVTMNHSLISKPLQSPLHYMTGAKTVKVTMNVNFMKSTSYSDNYDLADAA